MGHVLGVDGTEYTDDEAAWVIEMRQQTIGLLGSLIGMFRARPNEGGSNAYGDAMTSLMRSHPMTASAVLHIAIETIDLAMRASKPDAAADVREASQELSGEIAAIIAEDDSNVAEAAESAEPVCSCGKVHDPSAKAFADPDQVAVKRGNVTTPNIPLDVRFTDDVHVGVVASPDGGNAIVTISLDEYDDGRAVGLHPKFARSVAEGLLMAAEMTEKLNAGENPA